MIGAYRWAYGLTRRIRQPRVARSIMAAIYAAAFLMGSAAWFDPPQSLTGELGVVLTHVWAGFLIACGLFGFWGVWPGLWWAERVACRAGMVGVGIYLFIIMSLHVTTGGNRLPQFFGITIVLLVFIARHHEIRGVNYEPRPDRPEGASREHRAGIRRRRSRARGRHDPS